jgi:S-formylglutathione hydrolase
VLVYLAGLTCTEDNGCLLLPSTLHTNSDVVARPQKGGFFQAAASEGIALIFPDTSPRGAGVAGEDEDWDFGTGAGFYLDATAEKYAKHYNMAKFVTVELPKVIEESDLPVVSAFNSRLEQLLLISS